MFPPGQEKLHEALTEDILARILENQVDAASVERYEDDALCVERAALLH